MNPILKNVIDEVAEKGTRVEINYDYDFSERGYIRKNNTMQLTYFVVKRINSQNIGFLGTDNIKEIIDVKTKQVLYPV